MRRNPYYWKVDTQGRQLPYADRVRMSYIKDGEVQKLQLSAGAFDFTQWPPTDAVLFQQQRAGNYAMPARNSYYFGIRINLPVGVEDPTMNPTIASWRSCSRTSAS